ncbi:MAG TPA: MEDS domain-containing protein, partial [Nitrososphaeraceae archaeon]|nr:MEDS domain-containing protein [Nitrososphaeraceae archaeon]
MRYFDNNNSTNLLSNEHIMLLYEDRNKRNNFIIDIINEGLKNGCLCIYASVDIDDSKSISLKDRLSSRIINYEQNVHNENLKFINSKPYYESALKGDLTVFEKWKSELEYILYKRLSEGKNDKILIVGDVACTLYETRNFKECIDLEKWWQEVHSDWKRNNKDITVVCPHPNYVFKEESEQNIKNKIGNSHNATIDIENAYSLQYFYSLIAKNSNIDDLVNYQQTIKKTMKEIKYNFMEEHKNIISTYYSIFSKRLDEMIYHNLDDSKTDEENSNLHSDTNRNLMDNQTNNTRIINDIIDKNMDTFLKSIGFAHKFYFDVVQSYYDYIK